MSLSTARDNRPWTCEVHVSYDDNLNLYFRSLKSRRHSQEIAYNPNVSGHIVRQFNLEETPVGVYFEGAAKLLEDQGEIEYAASIVEKCLSSDKAAILADASNPDGHQFYKITIQNYYLFGKFEESGSAKYTLEWNE